MRNRLLRAAAQFLTTGVVIWALMTWLGGRNHLLYVWPLTAIQLAIVLGCWRNRADCLLQLAAAGAAVGLSVGALLDERRRAGQAADEAQSIYQTLILNAEDMIVLSTLDGARRFVSPAVEEITGWSPAEYLAQGPRGTMHPEDRGHAQTIIDSLAAGKIHHAFRYRIRCKDGEFRWVEASIRGYSDAGRVAGYVATIRDISAQKQTEESWLAERALLTQENLHLADLALRDELTGIPNRRAFNQVFDHEAARHARGGKTAGAADDRCRLLQAVQRPLRSSGRRFLPTAPGSGTAGLYWPGLRSGRTCGRRRIRSAAAGNR